MKERNTKSVSGTLFFFFYNNCINSPYVVPNPGPADKVPLGLNLRVKDRSHSAVVEGVGLAQVNDAQAVGEVGTHVFYLKKIVP